MKNLVKKLFEVISFYFIIQYMIILSMHFNYNASNLSYIQRKN